MRKASVHLGSGLSEERSATTLPHADPRYASEPTSNTHTHTWRYADIQTDSDPALVHALSLLLSD